MLLDPPSAPGTGDMILVQIGRPQTQGTLYFSGPWQYEDTIDSADAGLALGVPLDPDGVYPAREGQNQWIRITRIMPDGRYSTPVVYGPISGPSDAPVVWSSNPWIFTIDATGVNESDSVTTGAICSRIIDLNQGYSGMAFTFQNPSIGTITCTTTGAAAGTYSTILQVDNGEGTPPSYLSLVATVS
jgi:hypothetical protein